MLIRAWFALLFISKYKLLECFSFRETIARLPGGLSEQIAIKGRSSW